MDVERAVVQVEAEKYRRDGVACFEAAFADQYTNPRG
jgi:hypothetical protein